MGNGNVKQIKHAYENKWITSLTHQTHQTIFSIPQFDVSNFKYTNVRMRVTMTKIEDVVHLFHVDAYTECSYYTELDGMLTDRHLYLCKIPITYFMKKYVKRMNVHEINNGHLDTDDGGWYLQIIGSHIAEQKQNHAENKLTKLCLTAMHDYLQTISHKITDWHMVERILFDDYWMKMIAKYC